jgi:hypothetical protein
MASAPPPPDPFSQALQKLPVGGSLEFSIDEKGIPAWEKTVGESVSMRDYRDYAGMLNIGHKSSLDAAAMDQGFNDIQKGGKSVGSAGAQHGMGILERFWAWLVSWFWTLLIGGGLVLGALVVMTFIPTTSLFATTVLKWLGSVLPVIGAAIYKLIGAATTKKATTAFTQTVFGIQALKEAIAGNDAFDEKAKALLLGTSTTTGLINACLMQKQDKDVQTAVQEVKTGAV